jgi:hypothetical protein
VERLRARLARRNKRAAQTAEEGQPWVAGPR